MVRLVEAAVDAPPEVLDEGSEQARVGRPDRVGSVERQLRFKHSVSLLVRRFEWLSPGVRSPRSSGGRARRQLLRRIDREHRCLEALGVGMLRVVQHRAGVAAFDDLAGLHDDDAVADVVGGGEVVGDVDDRDAEVVAQRLEQVDDRHAERGVDHRHRLVGDDQRRLGDQRARDGDPLELAAGQLVRRTAASPPRRRGRPGAAPCRRPPAPRGCPARRRSSAPWRAGSDRRASAD